MMNKVFKDQVMRNVEVYVDDMLIKSRSLDDHLANLEENLTMCRRIRSKLTSKMCIWSNDWEISRVHVN